jgi:hypothetical protein
LAFSDVRDLGKHTFNEESGNAQEIAAVLSKNADKEAG